MASRTLRRSLALAGTALILSTSSVFADDISNALDATVDAVAEDLPLNVGGPSGTTDLYLIPRNAPRCRNGFRVDPELRRRAVLRAQAEGVSLNQWIARGIETSTG